VLRDKERRLRRALIVRRARLMRERAARAAVAQLAAEVTGDDGDLGHVRGVVFAEDRMGPW
jgi:hypothetical protein